MRPTRFALRAVLLVGLLALFGCPGVDLGPPPGTYDFSDFEAFRYRLLGDLEPGDLRSATITRENDGRCVLEMTVMVDEDCYDAPWDSAGEHCEVTTLGPRGLTPDEIDQMNAAFGAVEVARQTPFGIHYEYDVEGIYSWDGIAIGDNAPYEMGVSYLADVTDLWALLDDLRAGFGESSE